MRRCFERYLDKVFRWEELTVLMSEGRQHPRHPWSKVFQALFLGAACQMRSLREIELACRSGCLKRRVGPVSNNTLVYAMQRQDPGELFVLGCAVARRIKRNGLLRSRWSRGYVVVAVDGLELCSSYARCCPACLKRRVEVSGDGKRRWRWQYYHRVVLAVVVSGPFPVPLALRFQQPGESEAACAAALLEELVRYLGRRYFDIVVADALYLQTPFTRRLERLGLRWVLTLKDNQPDLAATVERLCAGVPHGQQAVGEGQLDYWYWPQLYWPAADRSVSVLQTVRRCQRRRVVITEDDGGRRRQRQTVEEVTTNCWASNLELGSIPPLFVYQLARSRWQIDAQVFQTLTVDCHFKHATAHQDPALVVWTMIRLLAYTLTLLFYCRQVLSHRGRNTPPSLRALAQSLHWTPPGWDTS